MLSLETESSRCCAPGATNYQEPIEGGSETDLSSGCGCNKSTPDDTAPDVEPGSFGAGAGSSPPLQAAITMGSIPSRTRAVMRECR